ncbi:TRAP transporter small permease [Aquamicrobium defluvii]|uniref:TRAP transporter small permease protein n=1 Tax=Aquamicrobium defluvii TaxID=69279 RepID=A0A011V5K4_9HYPH|nr:TRAP transporter small permease [Aquamicrobium defluvii]EXL03730.1 hypothetical protein BG36_11415 [Aquamicrobium defluvii]EZQ15297.1 hypothetical protein CF98_12785 [Halopseudomonas bauzanensis]TDR32103.1 TRAP-type C4-dicarboxylate transport system permease small subunit [Aquamicrobium defluvii]
MGISRFLLNSITSFEKLLGGLALSGAAGLLVFDVVSRELFGSGVYGAQKVAVYLAASAALLGMTVAVHQGGHLRITGIDTLIPRRLFPLVVRAGDALSAAVCLYLAFYAAKLVRNSAMFGEADPVLGFPIWAVQIILPVVFLLAALKYLLHAFDSSLKPAEMEE